MTDLYDVLGVDSDADQETIRKAYKKRASECHPDKCPDDADATSNFQELQKAYSLLSDPERRERYDRTGSENSEPTLNELADHLIATVWLHIAEQTNFKPKNYLVEVKSGMQNNLNQCAKEKKQAEAAFEKLKYLIDKTDASPSVIKILDAKLQSVSEYTANLTKNFEIMTRALELIEGYSYSGQASETEGYPWKRPPYSPPIWSEEPYIS